MRGRKTSGSCENGSAAGFAGKSARDAARVHYRRVGSAAAITIFFYSSPHARRKNMKSSSDAV